MTPMRVFNKLLSSEILIMKNYFTVFPMRIRKKGVDLSHVPTIDSWDLTTSSQPSSSNSLPRVQAQKYSNSARTFSSSNNFMFL
jgi:hypothetical protein